MPIPTRPVGRRLLGGALTLLTVVGVQGVLAAGPAEAATTFNVTTTSDIPPSAGACGNPSILTPPNPSVLSLREAVCLANNNGGASTVVIPSGSYTLVNGELEVGLHAGQSVNLTGTGAATTIINANNSSRVLDFDPGLVGGVAGTISGLTITGGSDSSFGGAGIIAGSGNNPTADVLTVDKSVITSNNANSGATNSTNKPGGGIQFIGGSLTVSDSTISNNTSRSSAGAGVAYIAKGAAAGESLTIAGTTFSGNTMTNTSGADVVNGGALYASGLGATAMQVTGSTFSGNGVSATTGGARGAAILEDAGTLTVLRSTFTGNSVTGGASTPAGGAIEVAAGTATLHYNRFLGNAATSGQAIHVRAGAGAVDATENWFGCNGGPGASGCDTVVAPADTDLTPRLLFTASASPSTVVGPNGLSTLTGWLRTDSDGNPVAPNDLSAFAGLPVTWSDPQPVPATVGSPSTNMSGGSADVAYDSQSAIGAGHVVVGFDNVSATVPITVNPPPPGQPTVTGSTPLPAAVRVTFSPPAGGGPITSYTAACVSTDGGVNAARTGTASPITVISLTPGKSYHCRVRASNAGGAGPYSPYGATVVVLAAAAPPAPVVSSSTPSAGAVNVVFAAPDGNGGSPITGYTAQCVSTDGGTTASRTGTASPIKVINLSANKSYHCRVRATNSIGTGPYSAYGSTVLLPAATVPPAPSLTSSTPSAGAVTVAFSSNGGGGSPVTAYSALCVSTDGGVNATRTGTASPIKVINLSANKSYHCRVRATNAVGTGPYSAYGTTVLLPAATAPPGPSVTSSTPSAGAVTVAFSSNGNGGSPITGYTAWCVSTDGGVTGSRSGTASPITVINLSANKTYHCRMRATNAVGTGPYGAYGTTVLLPAPAAPPGPTVTSSTPSAGAVTVAFSSNGNGGSPITGYTALCVSTDGGVTGSRTGTASPITVINLTANKSYHCRVRATNAVGTGPYGSYGAQVLVP